MKRNVWGYAWPIPLLLVLGPRTFAWRRRVWCRWLPAWECHPVLRFARSVAFAVRSPRMWWVMQRIELHVRFGFPAPRISGHNVLEA